LILFTCTEVVFAAMIQAMLPIKQSHPNQ